MLHQNNTLWAHKPLLHRLLQLQLHFPQFYGRFDDQSLTFGPLPLFFICKINYLLCYFFNSWISLIDLTSTVLVSYSCKWLDSNQKLLLLIFLRQNLALLGESRHLSSGIKRNTRKWLSVSFSFSYLNVENISSLEYMMWFSELAKN